MITKEITFRGIPLLVKYSHSPAETITSLIPGRKTTIPECWDILYVTTSGHDITRLFEGELAEELIEMLDTE